MTIGRLSTRHTRDGKAYNRRVNNRQTNTLAPLVDRYLTNRLTTGRITPDTAQRRSYQLDRLATSFGHRPLSQFGPAAIDTWLATLQHLAPSSRRTNLSAVHTFCGWLVDNRLIRTDPTIRVKLPTPRQVPRAFMNDQVAKLLVNLPDQRARVIVGLMLYCGLRCIEVSRLQVEDWDERHRTIQVRGKFGHERVLPVPEHMAHILVGHLCRTSGPLVESRNRDGQGLSPNYLSTLVSGWLTDAGVKIRAHDGRTAHALRHTCLSDVLDVSHDLTVVKEIAGHRSLSTTQIYLRRADLGRMRAAMEGRVYTSVPGKEAS